MNFPVINPLSVLPEIILLATSIVALFIALFLPDRRGHQLNYLGLVGVLAAIAVLPMLWAKVEVGFGGAIVSDHFALAMDAAILVSALAAFLLGLREVEPGADYVALVLWAALGMMVLTSAVELLSIFLGLEVLSLPLYVLAGFRRDRTTSKEAAMKYLLMGAFSSGIFLYGLAFLYGATGKVSLASIQAAILQNFTSHPLFLEIGAGLVAVGLAFKLALVPFHQWVPDVYEGSPTPVTAFMSVGTKAAAFGALVRILTVALPAGIVHWQPLIAFLAVLTLLFGNLAALRQTNMKRMLAYSGIAQAGYLVVAIAANSQMGVGAGMFYVVAYAFMNIGAFAVVAALSGQNEEGAEIASYRGLAYRRPWLAVSMTVFLLALASIPPLVGFPGKFYILRAAVSSGGVLLAIAIVVGTMISLYYYLRPVLLMFTHSEETESPFPATAHWTAHVTVGVMLAGTLVLGILPGLLTGPLQNAVHAIYGL